MINGQLFATYYIFDLKKEIMQMSLCTVHILYVCVCVLVCVYIHIAHGDRREDHENIVQKKLLR